MIEPTQSPQQTRNSGTEQRAGQAETVSIDADGSVRQHASRVTLPCKFGDYELLSEVARGGMGVVYRARQTKLNRVVAIKMILAGQLAGDENVRRFQTEAEAAAQLDHPNIVPIYEIGENDGQHFFSMGYIEGRSLRERLRTGPLTDREAAAIVSLMAEAVQYAHDKGVIHRDLKPSNVLLREAPENSDTVADAGSPTGALNAPDSRSGSGTSTKPSSKSSIPSPQSQPMLTDFGLAKLLQSDSELTSTGQVMGTPAYMPPEQASGRVDQVGPLADVYSLGAVLYCCLTGRPPFQAPDTMQTLRHVLNEDPVPPRQLNPSADRDLETICLRCLEKNPAQRYGSAAEMAAELRRFLRGEPILARPVTAAERAWKWVRRRPTIAALLSVSALATVALLVLSVGYYYHVQLQREKDEVERQRAAVEEANDQLTVQRDEVKRQNKIIADQKADVESQKRLVEIERDRTRRIQYASDMNMADRAWQDTNIKQMNHVLYRNIPEEGAEDLRGWEWYYLHGQANWHKGYFQGTSGAREMALAHEVNVAATACIGTFVDIFELDKYTKRLTIDKQSLAGVPLSENDMVLGIAITPDSQTLALGFHSGQLVVWDGAKDEVLFSVRAGTGSRGYLSAVAITRDGGLIATGDTEGVVSLWDRSGKKVRDLTGLASGAGQLRFSPDETELLSCGGRDNAVVVWNVESGELLQTILGHTSYVQSIAWSPDATQIASTSYDEEVRIWDRETGKLLHTMRGHRGTVNDCDYRPDGKVLATCGADASIRLWDVATGKQLRLLRGHGDYVYSLAYTTDGKQIVSSSSDGSTRVWDLAQTPESFLIDNATPLQNKVVFNRIGTQIASIRADGDVQIHDSYSRKLLGISGGIGKQVSIDYNVDGNLGLGGIDGRVRIEINGTGVRVDLPSHQAAVQDLAFSPDGTMLATASDDHTCQIIDVTTRKLLHTLEQHENMVWALAWSPDNKILATAGHDYQLILWNPETGKSIRSWKIFNFPRGMTFSPDGQQIATPAQNRHGVDLYSVETGELMKSFYEHTDGMGGIAFSPDGKRLFTSSWDKTVRIWDIFSGQATLTLTSDDKVNDIALSPDGRSLVGVGDHSMLMWRANTPHTLAQPPK